jgi:tetratricopeptide (TPR) repeat protein
MFTQPIFAMPLFFAVVSAHPASAATRDVADQEIVDRVRPYAPQVVALLEQGEALATSGSLEDALGIFRQGKARNPDLAGLFGRRECEALTSLNRRAEAQNACWHALQDFRTPATIGATVRSLVSGPDAPSFSEVSQALSLVTYERTRAPGSPQLAAAMCDIALSMGDGIMLQHCLKELESAPQNYAPTRRARAALDSQCPPWLFWSGWLTILGAALATGTDALRRVARRRSQGPSQASDAPVIAAICALSLAFSSVASADPAPRWLSHFTIDDSNPEASVPSQADLQKDPLQAGYLLQDLLSKAELAHKRGDHMAAVKFYQALLKAVPNRAISLSRMCDEFEEVGDKVRAMNACGLALTLDGVTVGDYEHYVHLVLAKHGTLSDQEVQALTNVINHMKQDDEGRTTGDELECELALRMSSVAKLEQCTSALVAAAPNAPKTIMYQWDLAMRQRNYGAAHQLVTRAKTVGIKDANLQSMEQATAAGERQQRWMLALIVAGLLVLLGGLTYGTVVLSRRRASEPTPA